jgi:16S rRNA (uracil1498-N3)-methyltransferase
VEFALGDEIPATADVPITLLLAIFKFDRMEWAIEKCTELNVTTIIPVIARRSEKHLALAAKKRVERWRRIAREASEQSRRVSPPEIAVPTKLKDALGPLHELGILDSVVIPTDGFSPSGGICGPPRSGLRIVLAESEREMQLSDVLRSWPQMASLALAIGPEGGWTGDELQSFASSQWIAASLGDTILRAETAAIAALAIAGAEL